MDGLLFVDPTPAPTNNIRVLTNLAIRDNWTYAMWPNMSLPECSAIEEYPLISFRECCYALEYGLLGNLLPGGCGYIKVRFFLECRVGKLLLLRHFAFKAATILLDLESGISF